MEEALLREESRNKNSQLVSRSFVVTLASPEEIFNYFRDLKREQNLDIEDNFSFLRFLLALKDSKEKGGRRLTFFGGKIKENEPINEASQREVVEELGLTLMPGISSDLLRKRLSGKGKNLLTSDKFYEYYFQGNKRIVYVNTFFVLPYFENSKIGDNKIREIKFLSLEDLKKLIFGDKIDDLEMEEHLRVDIKNTDQFFIDKDSFKIREEILNTHLRHFQRVNDYLKRLFGEIFEKNPNISYEEFERIYRRKIREFSRKGFESVLIKKRTQFSELKLVKDTDNLAKKIIEGINGGFLGSDILYYFPQVIESLIKGDDLDTSLEETTEATQAFFNYFHKLLKEFFSDDELKSLDEEKFKLAERDKKIIDFTNFLKSKLKSDFNVSDEDIQQVELELKHFWSDFEGDLAIADFELAKGLVQKFRLLNEVTNATLGEIVLYMFGFEKYNQSTTLFNKKLMFESARQLLLFIKGILSIRYFKERSKPESLINVSSGIQKFFGNPVLEILTEITDQGFNSNDQKILCILRENDKGRFIVDEKPGKNWRSFLRKAFRENFEDIIDFSSYNIVYTGEDPNSFIEWIISGRFREEFLGYLKNNFPDSTIFLEEKQTFGLYNFINKEIEVKGKRTGSQSKRIVAQKYILKIDDQQTEIVLYPYLSTAESKVDNDDFWMGWLEKRMDDKNYAVRRMFEGENGLPSFYDLLFPETIYPFLYLERLRIKHND